MTEREYWLGFAIFPGIGPKKFEVLLQTFGSAEKAWKADEASLQDCLGKILSAKFISFRQTVSLEKYWEQMEKKQVWFVTLQDDEYPVLLKEIDSPPFVLFGKGSTEILRSTLPAGRQGQHDIYIGVVGTRKVTSYGRQVTEMITKDLVNAGCIIVSGLALGVDALAHQTTLDENGKTIAVLGCGVDCCYPSTNQAIYDEILSRDGAVISEFPISMQPSVGSFPSRNRIIAGMSLATVVTEGAEDSGSLITAEDALKYGRKVFAIPGPITSHLSNGPMRLIRKGAFLVTNGEDILKECQISNVQFPMSNKKVVKGDTKEEQLIIDLLQNESLQFDELVKQTKIDASQLGTVLSMMEINGIITTEADGRVCLSR